MALRMLSVAIVEISNLPATLLAPGTLSIAFVDLSQSKKPVCTKSGVEASPERVLIV